MQVISFGGGVQSTALLVLACQGVIPHRIGVFANVGSDAEDPATIDYIRDHAMPYAQAHDFQLFETQRRHHRTGEPRSLLTDLEGDNRSIIIPVRMANGSPGNRRCTADYKLRVVARWLRDHGATAEQPAEVAVGISTDEWERANSARAEAWERKVYPLLELGHSRRACESIIADVGLPIPPKSSCWFCPFRSPADFRHMAVERPELFKKVVALEDRLNEKRAAMGKDDVYFTRFGRPIHEVIDAALRQGTLAFDGFDDDEGWRCGDVCDT